MRCVLSLVKIKKINEQSGAAVDQDQVKLEGIVVQFYLGLRLTLKSLSTTITTHHTCFWKF